MTHECLLCVERKMDQGICQNGLQISHQTFSTLPTVMKKRDKGWYNALLSTINDMTVTEHY